MPDKFIVPQFIDNEDKILGPITVRQFVTMITATLLIFIEYKIFPLAIFIFWASLTAGISGTFGFVKINGQPFHIFFLNFLQTQVRPRLRVWDKSYNLAEIRALVGTKAADIIAVAPPRERPSSTRLRDLTLVVNTGGVYHPEEDQTF